MIKKKNAFTLVELIVVVTILIVLSTVSFLSYRNYSSKARDTRRLDALEKIKNALYIYESENNFLPHPDDKIKLYSGNITNTYGYQGYVGEKVIEKLNLDDDIKDPLYNSYYVYNTNFDRDNFQLSAYLENEESEITEQKGIEPSTEHSLILTIGTSLGVLMDKTTGKFANETLTNIDTDASGADYIGILSPKIELSDSKTKYISSTYYTGIMGSCSEYKDNNNSVQDDGIYLINIKGTDDTLPVYCDMTTDGGGWTLAFKYGSDDTIGAALFTQDSYGDITDKDTTGAKLSIDNFKSIIQYNKQIRYRETGQNDWFITYESQDDIKALSFITNKSYNIKIQEKGSDIISPFYTSHSGFIFFVAIPINSTTLPEDPCPHNSDITYERISYSNWLSFEGRFKSYCLDGLGQPGDRNPYLKYINDGTDRYHYNSEIWIK